MFTEAPTSRGAVLRKACPQLEVRSVNVDVGGRKRSNVYARYIPKPVEAAS